MFQELFETSRTIAYCVETTKLRVIHKSLLFDALKEEDNEELEEVLTALTEKYEEPEESKMEKLANWLKTKFSCGASKDSEAQLEKKNDENETMTKALQKLEEAHIQFAKEVGEEEEARHPLETAEVKKMKENIEDLKDHLGGEKKTAMPLWDAPNEQGETSLHMSTSSGNPEATKMLLERGANPDVQNSAGQTPLHEACLRNDVELATELLEHQAKFLSDNKNETPEIEKLFENQEADKVKTLMGSIVKSNDRVKIYQQLFLEKKILFGILDQQELLDAVLERDEQDDDLTDFVNYNNPEENENTALHIAVSKECYPACSVLLNAGDNQLRLNRDNPPPALENLLNHDKVSEITDSLVRGLLVKVRVKMMNPDEAYTEVLSKQNEEGETLLARIKISVATWTEVVRLPTSKKGLRFSVVNTELPGALQAWFKADGKEAEDEESVKMRELLLLKGVVMRISPEETDLREAVWRWNGRNKNLGEFWQSIHGALLNQNDKNDGDYDDYGDSP